MTFYGLEWLVAAGDLSGPTTESRLAVKDFTSRAELRAWADNGKTSEQAGYREEITAATAQRIREEQRRIE